MERGGREGAIIRGRRLFKVFSSKGGDYSKDAINRGTTIIPGNTVAITLQPATVSYVVVNGSITKTVTGHGFSHFIQQIFL